MAADIAFGSVDKIFKVVTEIKEAAKIAKQNREEVIDIQERVETVKDVVSELDETDVTKNPSMDRALENLHKTLHRALELVKDCEKKNMLCLLCTARDLSKQLLRVQDDISHKLLLVTLATTVHITKRLGKANRTRRKKNVVRRQRPAAFCRIRQPQIKLNKGRPVPKFGDWDVKNSASDEAYTLIFQNARCDKKTVGPGADNNSGIGYVGSGRFDKGETKVETGVEDPSATLSGLKMFTLSELNAATNNFSDDRVIGEGNYSTVYKGVLHDGLVVALKVLLDSHLEDSQTRLLDEVNIGAKLKHKNVVQHLGYCMDVITELVEMQTHVLVLDYLPNGSLGDIVEGKKIVEWSSCFRIIQEIAQGVHYLHEQRVIHGDLKPDNILFDTNMNPVIIDFGISIILEPGVDEEILDRPVGTLGYMAPETYELRRLSMKSDVFAFGVCVVKTIIILSTGRPDWYDAQDWVWKAGGIKGLLLPTVQVDESQLMEINRYLEVGWLCMVIDPAKRPTMTDVVQMLSGEKEPPIPKNRRTKLRWT